MRKLDGMGTTSKIKGKLIRGATGLAIRSGLSSAIYTLGKGNDCALIQMEPTVRCNLRCKMCERTYWDQTKIPKDATFNQYKRVIDSTPKLRMLVLTPLGEPLLNKDIFKIIKYAKKRRIFVIFASNGTVMTEDIARKLVSSGLDEISFSVDSSEPKIYAKIRVNSNLARVKSNIKLLVSIRNSLGERHPIVSLSRLCMGETVGDMPNYMRMAKDLGVDAVGVSRLEEGDFAKIKDASIENAKAERVQAAKLSKECGIPVDWKWIKGGKFNPGSCLAPYAGCFITVEGDMLPCCFATQRGDRAGVVRKFSFGNVFKQGFNPVWRSEKANDFRKKLVSKKFDDLPGLCKTCWQIRR
jgi:MoaA/NifB/PqqE/SkfB family radical SAM enzyme